MIDKNNKKVLFISDLDGTLLNKEKQIPKSCVEIINKQIKNGMNFTVATARTPATVKGILKDIDLSLPAICMSGGAMYDTRKGKILNCIYLERHIYDTITDISKKYNLSPFTYSANSSHIFVYYKKTDNEPLINFYNERKNLNMKTFIKGVFPSDKSPIYVMFLDKSEIINKAYEEIKKLNVNISYYEDIYNKGYSYLEIYSVKASKANALLKIKDEIRAEYTVAFGDNNNDISMLKSANYSYAVANATKAVKEIANEIIDSNENGGVGQILKIF